jgi:DNA-binding NarL/FixJ family response regulator
MSAAVTRPSELCILIVDDDADHRESVVGLLARRGFTAVRQAGGADEALSLLPSWQPHLILLDLAMPGRSGAEVLPELSTLAPGAVTIVVSNFPSRRLARMMASRGAAGYVEKSVPPARFVDEILLAAALTDLVRTHVLELRSELAAPGLGRRFARQVAEGLDTALVDDIELLVSELVTNAVIHAHADPRLEIHLVKDSVRVEIHDDDPSPPILRSASENEKRPGGRGLQLVDRLSTRWGSDRTDTGKLVWFEIERDPATRETR